MKRVFHVSYISNTTRGAAGVARGARIEQLLNDIRNASGCGGPPPTLALKDMPFLLKPDLMSFLRDYLEHPAFGPYWQEFELGQGLSDVTIPCLHLSGWYDSFVTQTMNAYERFTTETKADHRLLVAWRLVEGVEHGVGDLRVVRGREARSSPGS